MVLFVHWLTFSHIWTATRLSNKVLKQSLYLAFPNESWQIPNLYGLFNYEVLFRISAHCDNLSLEKLHVGELHFFFSQNLLYYNTPRIFISSNILCVIFSSLNATCSMSANIHVCHFVLKDMSTLLRSRSSFCHWILTLEFLIVTNDAAFSVHAGISSNEL